MYPHDIISEKRFRAYRMWWVPGRYHRKGFKNRTYGYRMAGSK
jgi:hypothetical protein